MVERVVLHIGAMKTGTSFLQSLLMSDPERLADAGVDYVGGRFNKQSQAVRDILGAPADQPDSDRRWRRLIQTARASDAEVALVSMEFLGFARPDQLDLLLAPLAGMPVEVVLTVRDQMPVLAAQWSTFTKNLGLAAWSEYLRFIATDGTGRPRSRAYRSFHRAQDVEGMVARWVARPEVTGIRVVTVPAAGAPRDELWRRFCGALRVSRIPVSSFRVPDNQSLGYESADLLRRVNRHLGGIRPKDYRATLRPLIRQVLAPRRAEEGRIVPDRAAAGFALERNASLRTTIAAHEVWGSLSDLPVDLDLSPYPERVVEPRRSLVLAAGHALQEHLAPEQASANPRADDLDRLGREIAASLRDRQASGTARER